MYSNNLLIIYHVIVVIIINYNNLAIVSMGDKEWSGQLYMLFNQIVKMIIFGIYLYNYRNFNKEKSNTITLPTHSALSNNCKYIIEILIL